MLFSTSSKGDRSSGDPSQVELGGRQFSERLPRAAQPGEKPFCFGYHIAHAMWVGRMHLQPEYPVARAADLDADAIVPPTIVRIYILQSAVDIHTADSFSRVIRGYRFSISRSKCLESRLQAIGYCWYLVDSLRERSIHGHYSVCSEITSAIMSAIRPLYSVSFPQFASIASGDEGSRLEMSLLLPFRPSK